MDVDKASTEDIKCKAVEINGVTLKSLLSPCGISFKYSFDIDGVTWVISGDYRQDSCDGSCDDFGFALKIKIGDLEYTSESESCLFPFSQCEICTRGLPIDIEEEYEDTLFKIFKIVEKTLIEFIEVQMLNLLTEKYSTK